MITNFYQHDDTAIILGKYKINVNVHQNNGNPHVPVFNVFHWIQVYFSPVPVKSNDSEQIRGLLRPFDSQR